MSINHTPLVAGIAAVRGLFEESCVAFSRALSASESAGDAVDFTGHMHALSLAAGRVQAFGEALTVLTSDPLWNDRAADVVRSYLIPESIDH